MENKLVIWAGTSASKQSLEKSIKDKLSHDYLIKEQELTVTDSGFGFLFDDETGSEIEISFSQKQDFPTVYVSGNCSWDVVRLYEEILALLPDEEGACGWCGEVSGKLRHPHLYDFAPGEKMCKGCWNHDRGVYLGSYGDDIGPFDANDDSKQCEVCKRFVDGNKLLLLDNGEPECDNCAQSMSDMAP